MWLFPFKNHYLKSSRKRDLVYSQMLEVTFLSDDGYRREAGSKKYFYGEVNDMLFSLQALTEKHRLVPFIDGKVQGVGDDIFIFLELKSFRHRRIYLLILLFALAGLGMLAMEFYHRRFSMFSDYAILGFMLVDLAVWAYLLQRCFAFWRIQKNTLDFFRGLLEADAIAYKDIPGVFKL